MIRRAQAGDRQAFGVLFDAYYPRVYRYLNDRLGGAPEAEDLCQEVFLTVLGSIDQFACDGPLGFDEWLLHVARRKASDHYRSREQVRKIVPQPAAPVRAAAQLNGSAVSLLTDRQRQIVLHRFHAGLSVRQTATVLRLDAATVRRVEHSAFETWLRCAPPVEE
ncbi:MAG: RNA polymerase sigma factor [Dehalococcoidia bacterium]